jgi:hypothetical protein
MERRKHSNRARIFLVWSAVQTVLLVELDDLELKATTLPDVIVEFVPESEGSQFWARNVSNRAKIETPDRPVRKTQ